MRHESSSCAAGPYPVVPPRCLPHRALMRARRQVTHYTRSGRRACGYKTCC